MKNLFLTLAAISIIAACTAESGTGSLVPVAPYTLSVDRHEIESDGKQEATFTITDAEGKVLTDDKELMSKIYFKNEATGKRLTKRAKTFKSVEDGEYTFSATVSGESCENTVTIVSSGRSRYEVYRKNVALYRFTATWCSNCPSMTQGLDRVSDWTKDRIVELDLHGAGSTYAYSDGSKYVADHLISRFAAPGFPSCVYDLDVMSETRVYSDIEDLVFGRIADAPATCGIKAVSAYADGKLTVTANVKSSTGGRYDIGFAVLRDDCVPGGDAYEEEYDNVVVALSGNYEMMSSDAFELQKGAESAPSKVELALQIPDGADSDDFSVVVFALKSDGDDVDIDNIVELPFNSSVDYILN